MVVHDELSVIRTRGARIVDDRNLFMALLDLAEIVDEVEDASLRHQCGDFEAAKVVFARNQNKARNAFAAIKKAAN